MQNIHFIDFEVRKEGKESPEEFLKEDEGNPSQSPSIPRPDIVEDESDYDLNKDREALANIRKERAESWQLAGIAQQDDLPVPIAVSNQNHFGFLEA